jgi:hypothetical protein
MPRGSRPGERRGGRQIGTPNKKTLLRNAALAAADRNLSPLDYLLNVMREQTLPLETRVAAAREALPYSHSKPQVSVAREGTPGRYGNVFRSSNVGCASQQSVKIRIFKGGSDSAPSESEAGAIEERGRDRRIAGAVRSVANPKLIIKNNGVSAAKRHDEPRKASAAEVTPLEFLLGVMRDPDTPGNLRLRVASLVARYVHPQRTADGPRKIVVEDATGFSLDPMLAIELRNATFRLEVLSRTSYTHPEDTEREAPGLKARVQAITESLKCPCPSMYGLEQLEADKQRLNQLYNVRVAGRKLTREEDVEEGWLTARVSWWSTIPEHAARARLRELTDRAWPGWYRNSEPLSLREQAEVRILEIVYPKLPPDMNNLAVKAIIQMLNYGREEIFNNIPSAEPSDALF